MGLVSPGLQQIELPRGRGLLIDPNTRIPGLVSAKTPTGDLRVRTDPRARSEVAELKTKLQAQRRARARANVALGVLLGALTLLALGARSAYLARASLLAAPAMLALGLAWRSSLALFFGALVLALAFAVPRRLFPLLCAVVFAGALLVLWHWPVTNALATIGPHPDGGRRFYGMTNQVNTLLLPPALVGGFATAPLALVTVGWSKAGADGGGIVAYAAGYAMLALRRYGRVTWRRVVVAASLVVAAALVLVGLDAATGGTSHVTHSVGTGLPGELAHRWRVSFEGATRSWGAFTLFAIGVFVLVLLARVRPRPPLVDAMLVALATSLIVNDTPQDVAFYGAFGAVSLLAYERTRPL